MVSDVMPGQLFSHESESVVSEEHASMLMLSSFLLSRKALSPIVVSLLPLAKVTVRSESML